jgi:hypothetical protein
MSLVQAGQALPDKYAGGIVNCDEGVNFLAAYAEKKLGINLYDESVDPQEMFEILSKSEKIPINYRTILTHYTKNVDALKYVAMDLYGTLDILVPIQWKVSHYSLTNSDEEIILNFETKEEALEYIKSVKEEHWDPVNAVCILSKERKRNPTYKSNEYYWYTTAHSRESLENASRGDLFQIKNKSGTLKTDYIARDKAIAAYDEALELEEQEFIRIFSLWKRLVPQGDEVRPWGNWWDEESLSPKDV